MAYLRERGHQVEAIELAFPADRSNSPEALMSSWASQVAQRVSSYDTPVVLVGHSRAGLIVSQAAELVSERIKMTVYCAAYLVDHGETLADARARLDDKDRSSLRFEREPGGSLLVLDPSSAAEMIYSGCPFDDMASALANLRAEPAAGFGISPRLTPERYGMVPRGMIECLRDRILSISLQRSMRKSQPCQAIVSLDCDHAPFFSEPKGLASALIELAAWSPPVMETPAEAGQLSV